MKTTLLFFFFLVFTGISVKATIRYVKSGGTGNGSSWNAASGDLQLMITNSADGDQVWVAKGTYTPPNRTVLSTGADPADRAFVLHYGVKIYGGFPDHNNPAWEDRDWVENETILSGHLGNDLYVNHVVISVGNAGAACLDGFVIRDGKARLHSGEDYQIWLYGSAQSHSVHKQFGGGISLSSSSPRLENLVIRNNSSEFYGGGIYTVFSSPTLVNVTITDNYSSVHGGGMVVNGNSALSTPPPVLHNVTIEKNTAYQSGGGVSCFFPATFNNVTIRGNRANSNGGGLFWTATEEGSLTNVVISGNIATNGGGMYLAESSPVITNATISGNYTYPSSTSSSSGIRSNGESNPLIRNSVIWGNTGAADYTGGIADASANNYIKGLAAHNGSEPYIGSNFFIDPVGAASNTPTAAGDFRLKNSSPAIDAGNSTYLPAETTTDRDGNPRIRLCHVDAGAFEYAADNLNLYFYVDGSNGSDSYHGMNWNRAYKTLGHALQKMAQLCPSVTAEIYVAGGIYYPTGEQGGGDRDAAFVIPQRGGVKLYGGYDPGSGARDIGAFPTILSGDINTPGVHTDNSHHVMVLAGLGSGADSVVIDGFTITGGYAMGEEGITINNTSIPRNEGGGIYAANNSNNPNIAIRHCRIQDNKADRAGGMRNVNGTDPLVAYCFFSGNEAIINNGGAMYNSHNASPLVLNSLFTGNKAQANGGAVYNYYNVAFAAFSCTISGNNSMPGSGAVHSYSISEISNVTAKIYNSIVWQNSGGVVNQGIHSISPVAHSLVQGWTEEGSISGVSNPVFRQAPGYPSAPFTGGDYRVRPCVPIINAGNNEWADEFGLLTDLAGNPRKRDGITDIGAYENRPFSIASTPGTILYATDVCNDEGWLYYYDPEDNVVALGIYYQEGDLLWGVTSSLNDSYGSGDAATLEKPFGQNFNLIPLNRSWTAQASSEITEPLPVRYFVSPNDLADLDGGTGFDDLVLYKIDDADAYDTDAGGYQEYAYTNADLPGANQFSTGVFRGLNYVQFAVNSLSSGALALKFTDPLPVSLAGFSVRKEEHHALLTWQTTAEVNTSHFDIERSTDSRAWQKIGQVASKGTEAGTAGYTFRDRLPLFPQESGALRYYRLKMTDLDGTFAYSGIRSLQWGSSTPVVAGIYPNPASEYIKVETATGGLLFVSDVAGRRMTEITAQAGINEIDVRNLPAGVYFVSINGTSVRWVKQR